MRLDFGQRISVPCAFYPNKKNIVEPSINCLVARLIDKRQEAARVLRNQYFWLVSSLLAFVFTSHDA
jgi:hypothetical protein